MNDRAGSDGYAAVVDMPFGRLGIRFQDEALVAIDHLDRRTTRVRRPDTVPAQRLVEELQGYLRDPTSGFSVALAPRGTPFQQAVWQALGTIAPGRVLTYGELATRVGSAPRAVGQACRRNPIPIVVPCHRVVAACGVGGYAGRVAGPALEVKRWLLEHEGAPV
ncbi:MAG: methylated-DNA--[protein]-cysteine S-methyltransferase [Gammaproteobacteria bacterium]